MGIFKRDPEKKRIREVSRKIRKHMKKNGIHGSDGLVVGEDGEVYYDRNQDGRSNPISPSGTPPYNPNP